jgi:Permeases of the drug/metabolite transporter (DMT) superfamily
MFNIHVRLVLMALLWSTSYPMGRLLSEYEAAEAIVMVRAFVAFLFLAGLAYANRELKLPYSNKVVGHFILLGMFGFAGHNFLLFKGLEHTQANTAAVINGAIPIAVILLDLVIFRKRISRISLVGVGLSFFGTSYSNYGRADCWFVLRYRRLWRNLVSDCCRLLGCLHGDCKASVRTFSSYCCYCLLVPCWRCPVVFSRCC